MKKKQQKPLKNSYNKQVLYCYLRNKLDPSLTPEQYQRAVMKLAKVLGV